MPNVSADSAPVAHLLLVDDDSLVLATLAQGLRAEGYAVDAVADGKAALAAAARGVHDLALLDVRLPDISGIDLARALRAQCGLPALFFSAYDERKVIREAVAEGGLGYVVKPVTPRQLVPNIELALARARDLLALMQAREGLEKALEAGRATSMAVGALMVQHGLNREQAFQRLRAEARSQRMTVEALAERLLAAVEALNSVKGRG